MRILDRLSPRGQLFLIPMAASVVSVVVACTLLIAHDIRSFEQAMKDDLHVVAEGIALNSTPALEFESVESAREILGALRADPHIEMAVLYDRKGNSVDYRRADLGEGTAPPASGKDVAWFEGDTLRIERVVRREGQVLGAIFIQSDTAALRARVFSHAKVAAVAVVAALLAALLVTAQLLKVLSGPST